MLTKKNLINIFYCFVHPRRFEIQDTFLEICIQMLTLNQLGLVDTYLYEDQTSHVVLLLIKLITPKSCIYHFMEETQHFKIRSKPMLS